MISYEDAVDEIFAQFKTAWLSGTPSASDIVGYEPEVRHYGVEKPEKPDQSKFWARVSQQTVIEGQTSLRNGNCGQRYTTEGLVFVQLFLPKSDTQSMEKGRKLAIIGRNAYRGKTTSGKVWFRNARVLELDPEEKWHRLNVIAEYEYDETG